MSKTTAAYADAPAPTTGAVATNDAANYDFGSPQRSVLVSNGHAAAGPNLHCYGNRGTDVAKEATALSYEIVIPPGQTVDLCAPSGSDFIRYVGTCSVFINGTYVAGAVQVKILSSVA